MPRKAIGKLTESEKRVLKLAGLGYTRLEIALHTHKAVGTVDKQINSVMVKLGASNIVHAVAIALKEGLI